jgi:iron complex outermembrane receptor protein
LSTVGIDGLSLDGGVRGTRDIRDLTAYTAMQTPSGPNVPNPLYHCSLVPSPEAVPLSQCGYRFHAEFTSPTWNVGLNYKITPESMVYATVSRGYRSGGFNEGVTSTSVAPFQPEYDTSYEIGTKNDFNVGGMPTRVNLAGYYNDYTNIQRNINFLGANGLPIAETINAARAHILGGEADITVKPTERLTANVSYAYVDPKYVSFNDNYKETNPAYFPPGTPAGTPSVLYPVDVSSSQFIIVSRHSVNVSLAYALPVPDNLGEPTLTASYYYRSSFYNTQDINLASCAVPGDPNPAAVYLNCYNHLGRLPGYGLVNLRLDWRDVFNKGFDFALFVNNVADKLYYYNGVAVLNQFGQSAGMIGPPRMFGASVKIPFGG